MNIRTHLVVAAALSTAACAPTARQATNTPLARSTSTLMVQNDNWSEVTVYLVRGPMRTRLGSVTAMTTREFAIPNTYAIGGSDVTVQAASLGALDSYVSPPIQIFPGAQVALNVAPRITSSILAVYARR